MGSKQRLKDDSSNASSSSESSSDDEDEGSSSKTCDCIALTVWTFFLVSIFLAQYACYYRAAGGDLSWNPRVYISGSIGIACALVVCLCTLFNNKTVLFRILGVSCALGFFVLFILFMFLPVVPPSSIIKIDTTLSFQSYCTNKNYVKVSELLTYSIDPKDVDSISGVERALFRSTTPTGFQVEGVGACKNANTINARLAESAANKVLRKTVLINFDEIVLNGSMPYEISLRLNYTARIQKRQKECPGSQCGTWIVPGSRTTGVMTSLSVNGGTAEESADDTGTYYITMDNTTTLDLGSVDCPYAWDNSNAYSWMWIVAIAFLCVGFCLTIPMSLTDGARQYAIPVTIGVVLIVIGGILGAIAYVNDRPSA